MFKLVSDSVLSLYNNAYTNSDWLTKYEHGEIWSQRIRKIIEEYLSKNMCILYGSKSIEFMIQLRNNNNMFKIKIADYDVYTTRPRQQLLELYELFKNENSFVWSVNCAYARHRGTCTLYVNDTRIIDLTYVDRQTFRLMPTFESLNRIRCVSYLVSMSAYTSVLSDTESLYMIPKTVEKLKLLSNEYPFRFFLNKDDNPSNIFSQNSNIVSLISKLTNILDVTLKNVDKIPSYTHYLEKEKSTTMQSPKDELNKNDNETCISDLKYITLKGDTHIISDAKGEVDTTETINENTKLPSFHRYVKPSNDDYFYTGSIAVYSFISAFGDNIQLGNNKLTKDQLVSYLFDNTIELYVENVNLAIYKIANAFKNERVECCLASPREFPSMYSNAVRLHLIDYNVSIYLYELTSQRFIEVVNVIFPSGESINHMKCSCYSFLLSHILLQMALGGSSNQARTQLHGKPSYEKYSSLVSILSAISNRYQSFPAFKPLYSILSKYTVGNRKSLNRSNDAIHGEVNNTARNNDDTYNSHTNSSNSKKHVKFNINYDLFSSD